MKCVICDTDFYYQSETDPAEDCWCGSNSSKFESFDDRIKRLRYRTASIILKTCEYLVDKLTERDV